MALNIFYILEACLLIANAIAILNDRFLKKSKPYPYMTACIHHLIIV